MSVTYRALDSGLVQLDTERTLGPISSQVVARSRRRRISALSLTSGPAGYGAEAAVDPQLGRDVSLTHELETQGGQLRVWSGRQPLGPDQAEYAQQVGNAKPHPAPVHFGVWAAGGYELLILRYSGDAEQFFTLLDDFSLTATAEGVACVPVDPSVFWFVEPASVIVDVPDVGIVEIYERAGKKARTVPRHRGTPVADGELFVGEPSTDRKYFLHVADSALSYFSPNDPDEPQAAIDFLAGLHVSWQR